MSTPIPTIANMQTVHDLAKSLGLGCRFWDDKKRYLIVTMPLDTPPPPAADPPALNGHPASPEPSAIPEH